MKRILITGWTGNTGGQILRRAANRWPEARFVGITRRTEAVLPKGLEELEGRFCSVVAALEEEAAVERAAFPAGAPPYDLLLHIAHVRHTPGMMRLAERHGVPRVLLMHTTGMYSRYQEYGSLYREIDDAVTARGGGTLPCWTILRPTMIYGNRQDHNMHKLIRALACWPAFPVFGDGSATFQPVHVEDVADAALAVLENPDCRCRAYDLSGATVMTYREILETITRLLGRRQSVRLVPVPTPVALAAARIGEQVRPGRGLGVTVEQVRRLQESKAYSHAAASADFGFRPRGLEEGLAQEIQLLAAEGLIGAPAAHPARTAERLPG